MAELRYDTETWKSRPTKALWDKLKKYISYPPQTTDTSLPPMFGWCTDWMRDKYGIYISVTPHKFTKVEDKDKTVSTSLSFHFGGSFMVMKAVGGITEEIRFTGIDFPTVMCNCLESAFNYLEENGTSK